MISSAESIEFARIAGYRSQAKYLHLRVVGDDAVGLQQSLGADMSFYELQMESITGESIDFSSFEGEFVLVVNLASK